MDTKDVGEILLLIRLPGSRITIPKDKQLQSAHAIVHYIRGYNTPYVDVSVHIFLGFEFARFGNRRIRSENVLCLGPKTAACPKMPRRPAGQTEVKGKDKK